MGREDFSDGLESDHRRWDTVKHDSSTGRHAGDHIHLWSLMMSAGLKLSQLTGMIAPYPTRGEISKRLAGQWYTPALFSARTRALVSVLKRFA